jgi:4-hydroxybenzoate polyprenyltransferase
MISIFRPKHWMKNVLVFIPAFFAGILFSEKSIELLLTFSSFSFIASSIYIVNDIKDVDSDKKHPTKRLRPIASGKITLFQARLFFLFSFFLANTIAVLINENVFYTIFSYFLLNIFYTYKLKRIPIIDVSCIATGFVLRIFAGALTFDIFVSEWLVIMVFLISMLIGFAKRRDDLLLKESTGITFRVSMDGYNKDFLNFGIVIMAAVVIVGYIMYTTNAEAILRLHNSHLYLSTFFVMIGILRYLQITFVEEKSGSPTDILWKDKFLQLTIFFWLTFLGVFIYL